MRTLQFVVTTAIIFSVPFTLGHSAEMATQGSGSYKAGMSGTFKSLAMEKEHLEMQIEVTGVVTDSPEDGPLFNATMYGLVELHAVKGEYTERGFARYTRPDGDMIFMTHEAKGRLGAGDRTVKGTFVGGTGKCAGITGGVTLKGIGSLKPPKEGTIASVSVGTYEWKMP